MVVTWTRVTNPPPAGNITLADDTEVDGSEGVVSHAGGFIQSTTTASPYYLKILEDAELDQAGGDITQSNGSALIIYRGKITLSGSDGVYRITLYAYGHLMAYGTSTKRCVITGIDITHRMLQINITYGATVHLEYLDIFFCSHTYAIGNDNGYTTGANVHYFNNVRILAGTTRAVRCIGGGIYYFKDCTLGDASCVLPFYATRNSMIVLIDCIVNQSNAFVCNDDCYTGCFVYTPITFTNVTPAQINITTSSWTGIRNIELFKISVNEGNALSDCVFSIRHNTLNRDFMFDSLNTNLAFNWPEVLIFLLNLINSANLTNAGTCELIVPARFMYYDRKALTTTWYDLSVSGGAYAFNDQYTLSLSKPGYRTETTTLWGSSDQTWNVTLQPQSDFDDIMDCCQNNSSDINEVLDLLENKLVINENTSELWLYDDTGTVVIKKWRIFDKDSGPVVLDGFGPANRGKRIL